MSEQHWRASLERAGYRVVQSDGTDEVEPPAPSWSWVVDAVLSPIAWYELAEGAD